MHDPSGHACSPTVATGSDTYTYDDNDNRTTVVEANGATSSDRRYCYDGLDRLRARQTAAACTTTSGDETYTYDDPGNRLTATGTTYTYDTTTGQLTGCSPSCGTVSSDSAGNLKQFNGWAYEYDAQNRLARACKAATCTAGSPDKVEFSYDGEGHRTQVKEYTAGTLTTTRDFRYQGAAIVEESTNGTVSRGYVVDDTGRILKVCDPSCAAPTTTYLVTWNGHGDALGLWRINGDGTLTIANSYTYSTWGTPTTTVASGFSDLKFRFLYVGASDVQWDDFSGLGLAYMHARHYSPTIGRFLQPDPAAAETNAYVYVADSPVTRTDPRGTCWGWMAASIFGGPEVGAGATAACWAVVGLFALFATRTAVMSYQMVRGDRWWEDSPSPYVQPERICARYCWLFAQRDKKALESLRERRNKQLERMRQPGSGDVLNHWDRNLRGFERRIKDILKRHPQWRVPGDPM